MTQGLEQADVDAGSHGGSHQWSNLSSDEDVRFQQTCR